MAARHAPARTCAPSALDAAHAQPLGRVRSHELLASAVAPRPSTAEANPSDVFGSGGRPRATLISFTREITGARTRSRTLSLSRARPLAVGNTNASTPSGG